jgi:protein-disulfide isomerase
MKKTILPGLLLLGVAIGYAFSFIAGNGGDVISKAEAEEVSENFINENLIPPDSDQKAEVESVTDKDGLYLVSVNLGGQNIKSYMTRDGKKFFPQAMNIENREEGDENSSNERGAQQQSATVSTKKETPTVDLFVMSYCPYGTQMQKAILPAVEALGGKIDFNLQFVDYLMHGEKEMEENLNQYCIQKEQPEKLFSYLDCFLATEESGECMKQAGVDASKIDSCIESTDQEYKITEKLDSGGQGNYPPFDVDKEANEQYGVSGSPTLVINGEKIQASRTPNALLATICSGFEDEPEECEQELSSSAPSPGFGSGQSGSDSSASCD